MELFALITMIGSVVVRSTIDARSRAVDVGNSYSPPFHAPGIMTSGRCPYDVRQTQLLSVTRYGVMERVPLRSVTRGGPCWPLSPRRRAVAVSPYRTRCRSEPAAGRADGRPNAGRRSWLVSPPDGADALSPPVAVQAYWPTSCRMPSSFFIPTACSTRSPSR